MKRLFHIHCLLALMLLTGCSTAYYGAMEKIGIHKREILVDRVEEAKVSQQEAQEQFNSALEQLTLLTGFDGGELEAAYDSTRVAYAESENSDSALNFDVGAMWEYTENLRAALAVKDVLAQKITTSNGLHSYRLDPQITAGFAYFDEFFTAALDIDLTAQRRFTGIDDNTQFIRFGVEANAWGQAQLRAGYEIDVEGTMDNSITAGVGLSPYDTISIDLAASYAGESQFGLSANLALTF